MPATTSPFDGNRVLSGPGTLYAAPLGSTEPTSVTGAWSNAWKELGYTQNGSTFTTKPKFAQIEVEEELWAIRSVSTGADADITFALAETTATNLALALNAGLITPGAGASSGTNADGSIYVEPPDLGTETRLMIGWDMLPKGSTAVGSGALGANTACRLIVRQALNTAGIKRASQKGNKFATFDATFSVEKPTGAEPFRFLFPASMA